MSNKGLISIITINFNNLEGLKKTVKSVINQTFQDVEYIVIDGGSTDGSAEYIQEMSSHLSYWISESDNGIYNGMNKGIKKSKGEYLQFLNSGDYFVDNQVLEKIVPSLCNCDLLYGNCRMIMPDGKIRIDSPEEKKLNFRTFFKGTINHQSSFIAKNLFQKYGLYDEQLKLASDWKFFFKAIGLNRSKTIYKNIDVVYYERTGRSHIDHDLWLSEKQDYLDKTIPVTVQDHFKKYDKDFIRLNLIKKHNSTYKIFRLGQAVLIRFSNLLDKWT